MNFQMNEDKMQRDSDVRMQHFKNSENLWDFLCRKKAGNVERENADMDDGPLNFQIHQPFTV